MSIKIGREAASTDLILSISHLAFEGSNYYLVMEKVVNMVIDFLAKEYIKKHQQEILAKIDHQAIINSLAVKIAEQLVKNLLEKSNEKL